MMALTKSPWPWKRLAGLREESDHDQIDLSQHAANSVSDLGRTATDVSGAVGPENVAVTLLVCGARRLATGQLARHDDEAAGAWVKGGG